MCGVRMIEMDVVAVGDVMTGAQTFCTPPTGAFCVGIAYSSILGVNREWCADGWRRPPADNTSTPLGLAL